MILGLFIDVKPCIDLLNQKRSEALDDVFMTICQVILWNRHFDIHYNRAVNSAESRCPNACEIWKKLLAHEVRAVCFFNPGSGEGTKENNVLGRREKLSSTQFHA